MLRLFLVLAVSTLFIVQTAFVRSAHASPEETDTLTGECGNLLVVSALNGTIIRFNSASDFSFQNLSPGTYEVFVIKRASLISRELVPQRLPNLEIAGIENPGDPHQLAYNPDSPDGSRWAIEKGTEIKVESSRSNRTSSSIRFNRGRVRIKRRTLAGSIVLALLFLAWNGLDFDFAQFGASGGQSGESTITIEARMSEDRSDDLTDNTSVVIVESESLVTESQASSNTTPTAKSIQNAISATPSDFGSPTEVQSQMSDLLVLSQATQASAQRRTQMLLSGEGTVTKFFGVTAFSANHILFLVDVSGSMSGANFEKLKEELERVVNELDEGMSYAIVTFSDSPTSLNGDSMIVADEQNKETMINKVRGLNIEGGSDMASGLKTAFNFEPEMIWLLSDGGVNHTESEAVLKQHPDVVVNTIYLGPAGDSSSTDYLFLKNAAEENGGAFAHAQVR